MQNETQIIRLATVIALTQISRSSIYKFVKDGTFPAPLKLSARSVGWLATDIQDWINSRSRCA
ncbi:MAG: helix-turn-helix transcriptional regulator [Methylobacter sp.]